MTTSAVARIIDKARIQLPGSLEGVLRLELFDVLKEFLQRTDAWQEDIIIPIQPNWPFYELPPFSQSLVNRLIWLEGQPPNSTPPQRGPVQQGHLERTGASAILKIDRPPSTQQAWCAHVALTVIDPTDNEGLPTLPEWVVEKYHDYLGSGLIHRMAMHPGKPYSNEKLAVMNGRRFEVGTSLAKKEVRQGHVYGAQSWAFPQTFRAHSQRTW